MISRFLFSDDFGAVSRARKRLGSQSAPWVLGTSPKAVRLICGQGGVASTCPSRVPLGERRAGIRGHNWVWVFFLQRAGEGVSVSA